MYIIGRHDTEYFLEVSKGNIPGASSVLKFGYNADIDSGSTPEDVWSNGGIYTFPSSASLASIVSSSTNDTSAGTGARTITIEGLDSNYNLQSETITLNGTTSVNSNNQYIRVFRAYVVTAGSGEVNAGNISITVSSVIVAHIPADVGQTQMAIYTVPAGYTAYLLGWNGFVVKKNAGVATLEFWERKDAVKKMKSQMTVSVSGTTNFSNTLTSPRKITEKTDIFIRCSYVSANDMQVFSDYSLILEKNG